MSGGPAADPPGIRPLPRAASMTWRGELVHRGRPARNPIQAVLPSR